MNKLTTYDPFREAGFDDLFRGFFTPVRVAATPSAAAIKMDVTENDKEYQVLAELPGVKKEEISITIAGSEVSISAEVKQEQDVRHGDTVIRAERYYGKIERAFALGQEVDEATAEAKYNEGVLQLTLPKKTVATAKKLAVH